MSSRRVLKSIYTNIENPASFGSPRSLYKAAKQRLPKLKYQDVISFLETQDAYTLHKPVRRRFRQRKTITGGLFQQYQSDLIDLPRLSRYNNKIRFLLVVICVFSRKAEVIPIKNKTGGQVKLGLQKIFKIMRPPKTFQTDAGKEYLNSVVRDYLKSLKIKQFHTSSDQKASLVERFIRTFKQKLFRYFTHKNTLYYLDVIPKLVDSYNKRKHGAIGLAPNNVNKRNEKEVWERQYGPYIREKQPKFKFQLNDRVSISKLALAFKKGYLPTMTKECFLIADRLSTNPPTYKLIDETGNLLKGAFYANELQRTRRSP